MSNEMTVKDVFSMKLELERKIAFLIREFEDKTEIAKVINVKMNRPDFTTAGDISVYGGFDIKVDVKL